ncbi:MAG: cytochrome c oxidase subunit II [Thermomicrobiales bacterium]
MSAASLVGFSLPPGQASTVAGQVDHLLLVLVGLALLFAVPVCGLLVYFSIKYRRGSKADRTHIVTSSLKIELAWTIGPTIISLFVFAWAASIYFNMFRPPANSLEINVVGKQWMWKAQQPNGKREINELHVPTGQPIKLTMTSEDVIHDFYVPAFRLKHDVIPGRYSTMWFTATTPGRYRLFCSQYCGTDHAGMIGWIIVMSPADYQQWLSSGTTSATLAAQGEQLFHQYGCSGCHLADGSGVGPSLVGIYGRPTPLEGGGFATVDDQYIRDSILLPQKQVAAGYKPVMPSFQGQIGDDDILAIIAYIKSLQSQQPTGGQP